MGKAKYKKQLAKLIRDSKDPLYARALEQLIYLEDTRIKDEIRCLIEKEMINNENKEG